MSNKLNKPTKRNRFSLASGLVRTIGLLLTLCTSSTIAGQPVRVLDARGHWLALPQPAQRIVALAPHIVENLYSAGAGDRLIGVISHSDFPAAARQLPQVGNYKSINYERLLALKPDLIVAWGSGNGDEMIQKLRDLGFNVFVTESRTLEDIPHNVRLFGKLTGTGEIADRATKQWLDRLHALRQAHESQAKISVLYQVWNDPLQTLNGDHLISDVIEACGGHNAFADAVVLAPKISIESVLKRDPDVIIASGMGDARPEWLNDWKAYPGLSAVKNGNLYHVPPDIIQRHTFRLLDGMEMVCRHLASARAGQASRK
ncbi:cobalamin-binding protein [Microbulbifer sp. HZ11]|uniref:cobalamin-binding protein n=1 Tax=Microbulbifer sp. HZ11 TaxID=1453501 RepID=UPI0009E0B3AB|nr:cobalamin-binding protein [Microbulbifer sp. HZ11]